MRFELKNVKTFDGTDGGGFEATIYADGKRVGKAFNGGMGGMTEHYFSRARREECDPAFERFAAKYCAEQGIHPDKYSPATELCLCAMVDQYEERKILLRHCRTKTMFQLQGDADGEWRSIKGVGEAQINHIRTKYGDQVSRIANEELAK